MELRKKKAVVLGGGGSKGAYYRNAFAEGTVLEGKLKQADLVAGSSAGAMTAYILGHGATAKALEVYGDIDLADVAWPSRVAKAGNKSVAKAALSMELKTRNPVLKHHGLRRQLQRFTVASLTSLYDVIREQWDYEEAMRRPLKRTNVAEGVEEGSQVTRDRGSGKDRDNFQKMVWDKEGIKLRVENKSAYAVNAMVAMSQLRRLLRGQIKFVETTGVWTAQAHGLVKQHLDTLKVNAGWKDVAVTLTKLMGPGDKSNAASKQAGAARVLTSLAGPQVGRGEGERRDYLERTTDLLGASIASGAFPGLFKPAKLKRYNLEGQQLHDQGVVRYTDGGVIDNLPYGRAYELGAREITALRLGEKKVDRQGQEDEASVTEHSTSRQFLVPLMINGLLAKNGQRISEGAWKTSDKQIMGMKEIVRGNVKENAAPAAKFESWRLESTGAHGDPIDTTSTYREAVKMSIKLSQKPGAKKREGGKVRTMHIPDQAALKEMLKDLGDKHEKETIKAWEQGGAKDRAGKRLAVDRELQRVLALNRAAEEKRSGAGNLESEGLSFKAPKDKAAALRARKWGPSNLA